MILWCLSWYCDVIMLIMKSSIYSETILILWYMILEISFSSGRSPSQYAFSGFWLGNVASQKQFMPSTWWKTDIFPCKSHQIFKCVAVRATRLCKWDLRIHPHYSPVPYSRESFEQTQVLLCPVLGYPQLTLEILTTK